MKPRLVLTVPLRLALVALVSPLSGCKPPEVKGQWYLVIDPVVRDTFSSKFGSSSVETPYFIIGDNGEGTLLGHPMTWEIVRGDLRLKPSPQIVDIVLSSVDFSRAERDGKYIQLKIMGDGTLQGFGQTSPSRFSRRK